MGKVKQEWTLVFLDQESTSTGCRILQRATLLGKDRNKSTRKGVGEVSETPPTNQRAGAKIHRRNPLVRRRVGGVRVGGEVTGTRSSFHQTPRFPRVKFERGVKTTGRGSVERIKRSQAFSIQSLGENPCANRISNRRIIRVTTYLS